MRRLRTTAGVIATVCAFGITAAPALAHEFEASATGATIGGDLLKGGTQTFKLKPFTIKCTNAKSAGTATAPSSLTITDEVSYSGCTSFGTSVKFESPLKVEYNAEGTIKILDAVNIKIKAVKCVATIAAQSLPTEEVKSAPVNYSIKLFTKKGKKFEEEFPEGQKKLIIENKFRGLSYSLAGGLCEELEETSGEAGSYKGSLIDEIAGGQLGWL